MLGLARAPARISITPRRPHTATKQKPGAVSRPGTARQFQFHE
jgi:hypothetical protein